MDWLAAIDFAAIAKIIGIDIMLGVDNAIVIALACAALPPGVRGKAVFWGTAGAVALRAILLVFAGLLMGLPWVKLIAGGYLLYLGVKLLSESDDGAHNVPAADRMFTAIKTVIVADFMMSLDNVLAVAAAANSAGEHSTVYAILGIALSIPVIVFGATSLMKLMERFPVIIWLGAGLLGVVGIEMVIADPLMATYLNFAHTFLGNYTELAHKTAGFFAVLGMAYALMRLYPPEAEDKAAEAAKA